MYSCKDIINAHTFSIRNKDGLLQDSICGCFDCLTIFNPSEIKEWVDKGLVTAICPYCGNDAIIGESSGYPINLNFLRQVKNKWCS